MNDIGVQNFLQGHNFTLSCPRPPAIGEEHDVVSVDGRQSTHSSISGKSEVSTATPRRSDIDLGFEPEGIVSPMIPCERWKLSLHNVLDDSDGIKLFYKFLSASNKEKLLDCWLACKGFKDFGVKNNCSNGSSPANSINSQKATNDTETHEKRCKLAKKIFTEYMKKDKPKGYVVASILRDETRQSISRQIRKGFEKSQHTGLHNFDFGSNLFDSAQNEIERHIEKELYSSFIQSDLFFNYMMQHETKHTKQQAGSSVASQNEITDNSSQQQAGNQTNSAGRSLYLPRINEDRVWDPPTQVATENQVPNSAQRASSASAQQSLARTAMERAAQLKNPVFSPGSDQSNPAYPYYAAPSAPKYYVPPASANASDNASSDATSDTLSVTDGSIDLEGGPAYGSKKHQKRIVRHQAKRNHAIYNPAEEYFVPVTRRCQYKQELATIATDNPKGFFSQLEVKLKKVAEDRSRQEMLEASSQLDNEDDILDNHIERVMKTPNPVESPSRSSPPPVRTGPYGNPAQSRTQHLQPPQTHDGLHRKIARGHLGVPVSQHSLKQLQVDRRGEMLKKYKEVPMGMTQNEVPEVPDMPVLPVDKREFVHEWIKQQGDVGEPVNPLQKKGVAPKAGKYINPRDNFPTSTSKAYPYHGRSRVQPTSQDMHMPPLPRPDPTTMLDEVKRRLIAETESEYDAAASLTLPGIGVVSGSMPVLRHGGQPSKRQALGNSSNTARTPEAASESNGSPQDVETTCLYQLPNEEMWYKIRIAGNEITLEQFKNSIQRRRGNCSYFFKQYSKEIDGPAYFEIRDNDEVLPFYEKSVVAKIQEKT